jgi:hypothetical protein
MMKVSRPNKTMKTLSRILGPLALALTIVPAILFAFRVIDDGTLKGVMLAGCVLWFVAAPQFMSGGSQ